MMRRLSTLLSILLLITATKGFSQHYADEPYTPRPSYGLFGGLNLNLQSSDFKQLLPVQSCCPGYESGTGLGYSFGLFYAIPVSTSIELSLRGQYSDLSGTLSKIEPEIVAGLNGQGVNGEFEHSIDAHLSSIGITPMISYRMTDQFRLSAGLHAGLIMNKTFDQKEVIKSPSFGVFRDTQSKTRAKYSGDIPGAASMEASVLIGASYDLPLNSEFSLFLSPEAYYYMGLTNVSSSASWKVNTLQGRIALRYAPREYIPPKPPPIPPPPPPLPPPPPPPAVPVLDANVLAVGVDDSGTESDVPTLKVEEFLFTRMHPILNYIFFDDNSEKIPDRYTRMSDEEKRNFSVKLLYNLKTMDVYHQVLNIIGKRMEFYPQARITLVGCNSNAAGEKGNTTLSENRANAVKKYLVDVWKLDPGRIKVETRNLPDLPSNPTTEEGNQENRRVEVIANIPQVFEPMIIQDTIREANPPHIRFKSKINSSIGVNTWDLITQQNNRNLRTWNGKGLPPASIDWNIKSEEEQAYIPRFAEPLNYKLQVTDNDNKVWESSLQTLPVEQLTIQKKMMEMIEDKEIDNFSLILFGFNQSNLSEDNKGIAEFAKRRIQPNSIVTIRGYTDRVGEEAHNQTLSLKRAEATAQAVGVDKRFAKGMGEKDPLYDNNLPEGRFYCRTVNIEIVTPIQAQ